MRIGVDIDDTITNSWECLIPYYSKLFGIPETVLHTSPPYHNSVKHLITLDDYFKVLKPVYDEVIPNVTLKDDVKETIDKLYEMGHKVYFITARGTDHTDPYKVSKDYLDKHGIKYEKIIVGSLDKVKVCKEEQIDLLIDDSRKHCLAVSQSGIETLLFETYYNKDCQELKHVKSWKEIYEYIKGRWADEQKWTFDKWITWRR